MGVCRSVNAKDFEIEQPISELAQITNSDDKYIVKMLTRFNWNRKPMSDDKLREYLNQPTVQMKEKIKIETEDINMSVIIPRSVLFLLDWEPLTKGTDIILEYRDQMQNKNISEDEYCQILIEKCYHLEDITYAQYKFLDSFEDNNIKFYNFDHWNHLNDSPGGWLMHIIPVFETQSDEKYIFKYNHQETIFRWYCHKESISSSIYKSSMVESKEERHFYTIDSIHTEENPYTEYEENPYE